MIGPNPSLWAGCLGCSSQGDTLMRELGFDGIEVARLDRPVVVTLEVSAADVELAFATAGSSLRQPLMSALLMALTLETGDLEADSAAAAGKE